MVWNGQQVGVYACSETRLQLAYYAAVNTIVLLRSVEVVYTMPKERKVSTVSLRVKLTRRCLLVPINGVIIFLI